VLGCAVVSLAEVQWSEGGGWAEGDDWAEPAAASILGQHSIAESFEQ